MSIKTPITVAYGDGIGPEIMTAVLNILKAANAKIDPEFIEVGEKVFLSGNTTGIPEDAWKSMLRTKVLLKAPITTPQGGGYKSLNVTIRKTLSLYANVRPCASLSPIVPTHFPEMDVVIIRENEEDLYAGIEHRQTHDVYQCLKLISRPGCERIVHYAFEYARKFNRKKVTCFSKDNIMKMTDGIFHQVFNEIAKEYPDIEADHYIIDIGTALLATHPDRFDVIVTSNLYGDIISDVAAQIVGSVGLAGSANVGDDMAMFEAIHGSAPDIAGKNIANPSGLLNGAVQMLIHINQPEVASTIQNAWLKTLEDGIHTADIYSEKTSQQKVSTQEFAQAVIDRLGQQPTKFAPVKYVSNGQGAKVVCVGEHKDRDVEKRLVGVDVFLDNTRYSANELAEVIQGLKNKLALQIITSRGVKVWPKGMSQTVFSDHCRCRFQASDDFAAVTAQEVIDLLQALTAAGLDVVKTENLYFFGDERGFSLAQGQ
ncbi:MAG: NADP-dependent isocitrate dehydrogenase [Gammaproteobacteria bacterium]